MNIGKSTSESKNNIGIGENVVKTLAEPFFNTNRTITADNFFSSIKLAIDLIVKGITFVGTLRKNKSQIPESFLPSKETTVFSSKFAFTKHLTICSYAPKFNKSVIMLSSLHHDKNIIENNDRKPEIIHFYNKNKMGCDAFDQSCANNTCRRRTNRWPFNVFCFILDAAVKILVRCMVLKMIEESVQHFVKNVLKLLR